MAGRRDPTRVVLARHDMDINDRSYCLHCFGPNGENWLLSVHAQLLKTHTVIA
jgi:hypothetical protein